MSASTKPVPLPSACCISVSSCIAAGCMCFASLRSSFPLYRMVMRRRGASLSAGAATGGKACCCAPREAPAAAKPLARAHIGKASRCVCSCTRWAHQLISAEEESCAADTTCDVDTHLDVYWCYMQQGYSGSQKSCSLSATARMLAAGSFGSSPGNVLVFTCDVRTCSQPQVVHELWAAPYRLRKKVLNQKNLAACSQRVARSLWFSYLPNVCLSLG